MSKRKNILVLYYTRGIYPIRSTINDHLYCWKQYSHHNLLYVNIALGFPENFLQDLKIDVIIYHTSFCGMRWSERVWHCFTSLVSSLNNHPAIKIAIPQDEFTKTDMLCEFLSACKIDYIFTCAYENEWEKIYGGVRSGNLRLKTVLTGYLDDKSVRLSKKFIKPLKSRSCDISYRAWRAAYWLGFHGTHKVRIGEAYEDIATAKGFNVDISLDDSATILGNDWLKFLADSRATIGVEGGASILDRDGSIKIKVDDYVKKHPRAKFEEVEEACFKGMDNHFALICISPRHLEAVATKTCQILIEGEFNGILLKDRHYISLKPDYSNIDETLEKLKDDTLVQQMVDTAYDEIVKTGRFTYRGFVKEIENEIFDKIPPNRFGKNLWWKFLVLKFRDWMNWRLIQMEVALIKSPDARIKKIYDKVFNLFVALPKW